MSNKNLLIVGGVAAALISGAVAAKIYVNNEADTQVKKFVSEKTNGKISVGSATKDLMSNAIRINDISIDNGDKTGYVETVIIHSIDDVSKIPLFADIQVIGAKLSIDQMDKGRKNLEKLGYTGDMTANARVSYKYDTEDNSLKVSELSIGVDDMGELSVGLEVGNINLDSPNFLLEMMQNYRRVEIREFHFTYEDDSLMERAISMQAEKSGKTAAEVKALAVTQLKENASKMSERDIESADVVAGFIQNGGSLTFSVKPDAPVELGALMMLRNPAAISEKLNVRLK